MISFCTDLNSGVPARSSSSKSAASTVVTTAPARSIRSSPRSWSSAWREPTASAATWTSRPLPSRSWTVWLTHTCVSIPHTSACPAPPRSKPSARTAEKTVFSMRGSCSSPTSGAVWPRPFGYCSLTSTGISRMRAPCSSLALDSATGRKRSYWRKPSWTSTTTSAARPRSSRVIGSPRGSRAHHREGPVAVRDGAARERQRDPPAHPAPGETAVLRAALPAVLACHPLLLEVHEHGVGRLAHGDPRGGHSEQRRPRAHPLDQRLQRELAGDDEPRVQGGERRLQSGGSHRRLLEGHFLLLARMRGVVGGD